MTQDPRDAGEPNSAVHVPVLLREVIQHLDLQPGQTVVDGTVGAGGHSRQILKQIGPEGTLIGLDRDPMMLQLAANILSMPNCHLRQASYAELPDVLQEMGISTVDRILLDIGLSSDQLADQSRGFSFESTGPLDLRFDINQGEPAWEMINRMSDQELAAILRNYGEERFSGQIAKEIVSRRKTQPVRTARNLVSAVTAAVPQSVLRGSHQHAATRVFQALRIAVNEELTRLQLALTDSIPSSLTAGDRAVVISFHSLEDRIVKEAFRGNACWTNLTSKPVTASPAERRINPRCRSAKLRAAKKR